MITEQTLRTSKENFNSSSKLIVSQVPSNQQTAITRPPAKQKSTFFKDEDKLSRLQKYEAEDDRDPLNRPFIPPQGFKGPVTDRKATDKGWIIVFLIIYALMAVYGYFVMIGGVPDRLANGMDFRGEICGIDGLKLRPYLYYAGPVEDIQVAWCVRQCPPSSGRDTCMYDTDHKTMTTFCYSQMQADLMGRYCIPKEPNNRALVLEQLGSLQSTLRRMASDLWLSWDITLSGFGLSILLSYLFTVLAKFERIVTGLIWSGVVGSGGAFIVFAWMCWLEADRLYEFRCISGTDPNTCGGMPVEFFRGLAYTILGLGVLYLIAMLALFRRINRGIGLLKNAQHIMGVLGQIRAFPFIVTFIGFVVCGLAFILCINAMTIGDITLTRAKYIDGHLLYRIFYDELIEYCLIFVLFALLFTLTLILTLNDMFTSYALSIWFFTKHKDTVNIPFMFSLKTLLRYHFGTCIFVSFNLMFLTIPQSLMSYTRTILRYLPQNSNVIRYMQACCMGCIHGFEIFLRYISKGSVVQVAIWSEPYYQSAKKAYFLTFRNQNKIKDLDFLQEFVVFQIKLCTALIASIPVYLYVAFSEQTFMGANTSEIETPIVPAFFVFFCGMFFTNVFQGSYDITCKTIIQLYLMDTEMFFGEQRFVEPFIREFMEYVGKLEDTEWKMIFTKQIKFDVDRYNKELAKGGSNGNSSDESPEREPDSDEEDAISEDRYSDQVIDYDEKQEKENPFIGLPTDFKPNTGSQNRDQEELGNQSQTMIMDQTQVMRPGQLRLKTPILNTSQQSFQIVMNNNEKSAISQFEEKPRVLKKQRL